MIKKIGVKSTAFMFGNYKLWAIALLQLMLLSLWIWLGKIYHLSVIYFIAVGFAAMMFSYQIYLIHSKNVEKYFHAFLNNQWVGLVIFLGLAIPRLVLYLDVMKHFAQ
jgi:4-hydroxybenzoate polyprenyltransferase